MLINQKEELAAVSDSKASWGMGSFRPTQAEMRAAAETLLITTEGDDFVTLGDVIAKQKYDQGYIMRFFAPYVVTDKDGKKLKTPKVPSEVTDWLSNFFPQMMYWEQLVALACLVVQNQTLTRSNFSMAMSQFRLAHVMRDDQGTKSDHCRWRAMDYHAGTQKTVYSDGSKSMKNVAHDLLRFLDWFTSVYEFPGGLKQWINEHTQNGSQYIHCAWQSPLLGYKISGSALGWDVESPSTGGTWESIKDGIFTYFTPWSGTLCRLYSTDHARVLCSNPVHFARLLSVLDPTIIKEEYDEFLSSASVQNWNKKTRKEKLETHLVDPVGSPDPFDSIAFKNHLKKFQRVNNLALPDDVFFPTWDDDSEETANNSSFLKWKKKNGSNERFCNFNWNYVDGLSSKYKSSYSANESQNSVYNAMASSYFKIDWTQFN